MKKLALILLVFALLAAGRLARADGEGGEHFEKERYGAPASAPEGWTLLFPDFKLRYLGVHGLGESDIPISIYDYEVEGRSGKKIVTYATLGDIAPHAFCFEGRVYSLELFQSDKFGQLAPYEIVLWQKPKNEPCTKDIP